MVSDKQCGRWRRGMRRHRLREDARSYLLRPAAFPLHTPVGRSLFRQSLQHVQAGQSPDTADQPVQLLGAAGRRSMPITAIQETSPSTRAVRHRSLPAMAACMRHPMADRTGHSSAAVPPAITHFRSPRSKASGSTTSVAMIVISGRRTTISGRRRTAARHGRRDFVAKASSSSCGTTRPACRRQCRDIRRLRRVL